MNFCPPAKRSLYVHNYILFINIIVVLVFQFMRTGRSLLSAKLDILYSQRGECWWYSIKKKKQQKNFIVIIFYDRFFNRTSFAWKLKKSPEITFILQCHFCHRTQLKKINQSQFGNQQSFKKDSICVSRSSRSNQETVSQIV